MSLEQTYFELCYALSYAHFRGFKPLPGLQLMHQEWRSRWYSSMERDVVTVTPWSPTDLTGASADIVAMCEAAYRQWEPEPSRRTQSWKPWWDYFLPDVIN